MNALLRPQHILQTAIILTLTTGYITTSAYGQTSEDPATFSIADKPFGKVIKMVGYINGTTEGRFKALAALHPTVKTLWIQNCDGSDDDEANVIFCRYVYNSGYSTYMEAGNEAHSGGVDLFVSGVQRYAHANATLGVHSWSDGSGTNAANLPRTHPEHQRYIRLYKDMWMTQKQAEDFYFFTINAAPPATTHNMTAAERTQYKINTTPVWPPLQPIQIKNTSIQMHTGNSVSYTASWLSQQGVSYRIEYTLDFSRWTQVKTGIAGTGNQISDQVQVSPPSGTKAMFFRIARE